MFAVRRWSTRHAGALERCYRWFERLLIRLHPLIERIGYARLDRGTARVERWLKGFLFDTRMCGDCTLGSTGMTCPMNCPKKMRNGPCGGVRQDGNCEVDPDMPCVWLDAFQGSLQIDRGARILELQQPVDHRLEGSSSWLRVVRRHAGDAEAAPESISAS